MGGSDHSMVFCVVCLCVFVYACVCMCAFAFAGNRKHTNTFEYIVLFRLCVEYRLKRTTQDLRPMRHSMQQRCYY